jgi:hypothetical protein
MSKVRNSTYRGHRFPAEVIAHAIWMYFRFPLGLGLVEDPPERSFAKANGGFAFESTAKQSNPEILRFRLNRKACHTTFRRVIDTFRLS